MSLKISLRVIYYSDARFSHSRLRILRYLSYDLSAIILFIINHHFSVNGLLILLFRNHFNYFNISCVNKRPELGCKIGIKAMQNGNVQDIFRITQ